MSSRFNDNNIRDPAFFGADFLVDEKMENEETVVFNLNYFVLKNTIHNS